MKVENAEITWLDSGLPYSTNFQDIYYSKDDALAESRHVFLEANRLAERWRDAAPDSSFSIAELGFGSGLNFLQTCKLWQECLERPARLHYIAFEKFPLSCEHIHRVHQCWPTLALQSEMLLAQYTDHTVGCHRLQFQDGITLDLYFGDAHTQLSQRMSESSPAIQCWFLDGFSPANNDRLWEESLMRLIAASSDESSTLSTYSVAGKVRAAIASAGFEVHKIEGFGRKRHSLFANRTESCPEDSGADAQKTNAAPWFILPKPAHRGRTAAIIGAGLAGCSTAYSLAQRGWQVTVFDAGKEPAAGASGIPRLALRCRLFNSHSAEAEFYLQAYLFALRQVAQIASIGHLDWERCGVLQLMDAMNKRSPLQQETLSKLYSQEVVRLLDHTAASKIAGLDVRDDAWHFPSGVAIGPASLCQRYLTHPNIRVVLDTGITALKQAQGCWELQSNGSGLVVADAVVVANSHGATNFSQCAELPLQISRGQSSEVDSNTMSESLTSVVSGGRSVFPAKDGRHVISASYSDSAELQISDADRKENIRLASESFSEPRCLSEEAVSDRVALRCHSADKAPIVGMVPDMDAMRSTYVGLARNARTRFDVSGSYLSGLFINVAHGSNGLSSCPLSGEFLASIMSDENIPLNRDMIGRLSPTRFLISDLKKQRD